MSMSGVYIYMGEPGRLLCSRDESGHDGEKKTMRMRVDHAADAVYVDRAAVVKESNKAL
jgi:hypothetical protein